MDAAASLISPIYETALDPALWDRTLHRVARSLGAAHGVLAQLPAQRRGRPLVIAAVGTQSQCLTRLVGAYRNSPLAERVGRIAVGEAQAETRQAHAAFRRGAFHAEIWAPAGLGFMLIGRPVPLPSGAVLIGFARRADDPPFDALATSRLAALLPHLHLALKLRDHARQTHEDRAGLAAALDHVGLAVLLLDAEGRVRAQNRPARALLAQPGALRMEGGRLTVRRREEAAVLRATLQQAAAAAQAGRPISPPLLHLQARSGARLLSLLLVPAQLAPGAEGLLLCFISGGAQPALSPALVGRVLGLTPAEARLAAALAAGETLAGYAQVAGIAESTARVQARQVLAKTATHSQTQLVVLLLRGLAQLRLAEVSAD